MNYNYSQNSSSPVPTILVAGASGFVGRHLTDYLRLKGYVVQELGMRDDHWKQKVPATPYIWIHLVGVNSRLDNQDDSCFDAVNFGKTKAAFDFQKSQSNCLKFIFLSSIKSIVEESTDEIVDEMTPQNPTTAYGKSKMKAEKYLLLDHNVSFSSIILCPSMIYGSGNRGNLPLLFQFVRRRWPYPFASFTNKRSFLSINNLAFAIEQMIFRDISSGRYLIADGVPLSTDDLLELGGKALGKEPIKWKLPKNSIKLAAKVLSLLGFTKAQKVFDKLTGSLVVDSRKLKDAIGVNLPHDSKEEIGELFSEMMTY